MNKKQCRSFVGRSVTNFLAQTIAALLSLGSMLAMVPAYAAGESIDAVTPDVTYSINPGQYITFSFKWVCNGGLSGPYNEPMTATPYMGGQLSPYNGLTASLSPNPGTSNVDMESLTITAANNAVAGTYPIVVDGVGNPAGPCPTYVYPQFPQTLTLVVNGAQLKINLLPQPPEQNQYVIDATPKMPTIQASAQVVGITPDPTPQTTFTWTVNLNVKNGKGKTEAYDSYVKQNMQTTGTGTFTFTLNNASDIVGGNLTLNVSAVVNGNTLTAYTSAGLSIVGTNPVRATLQNTIGSDVAASSFDGLADSDVTDTLQRIACHETKNFYGGQVQYNAPADGGIGPVIIASDNGVGIFQLTVPYPFRDPNNLFNWPANVNQGVKDFKGKVPPAKSYPQSLSKKSVYTSWIANEVNVVRQKSGLAQITNATLPAYTMSGVMGTDDTAELKNELLNDSVRGYNGYAGSLVLPPDSGSGARYSIRNLHEFEPNAQFLETVADNELPSLSSNPQAWMVVPVNSRPNPSSSSANYVQLVAGSSPTCGG